MRRTNCSGDLMVFAAGLIVACCVMRLVKCRTRGTQFVKTVEEAVQTWEDEGGALHDGEQIRASAT